VVSALPDPEAGDRVSVAIIVGDARRAQVDFLENLPKLACLAPTGTLSMYKSILQAIQSRVENPSQFWGLAATIGPHFDLSTPRELYAAPDGRVRRHLINHYLRIEGTRSRGTRFSPQNEASHRLDRFLLSAVPGALIEKIATVERLFPELGDDVFPAPVPRLNRAVRTEDTDILIGAVVVDAEDNPLGVARDASARISQAFWQYSQSRERLQAATGRTIRTLGVVLNGTSHARPEVRSAKEYVLHLWEGDADELFAPERREDESAISDEVRRIVTEGESQSGDSGSV
jgi:hypothetical protein